MCTPFTPANSLMLFVVRDFQSCDIVAGRIRFFILFNTWIDITTHSPFYICIFHVATYPLFTSDVANVRFICLVELFLLIGGGILFGIMLLTIIVFAIRSRGNEGYEQLPN